MVMLGSAGSVADCARWMQTDSVAASVKQSRGARSRGIATPGFLGEAARRSSQRMYSTHGLAVEVAVDGAREGVDEVGAGRRRRGWPWYIGDGDVWAIGEGLLDG